MGVNYGKLTYNILQPTSTNHVKQIRGELHPHSKAGANPWEFVVSRVTATDALQRRRGHSLGIAEVAGMELNQVVTRQWRLLLQWYIGYRRRRH